MAIVILVRHGRSTANARGILAGRMPDVALVDEGRRQAEALAELLGGVDAAYTSPMQRCRETAACAGWSSATVEPGLDECDYGDWSGGELATLAGEGLWARIQADPTSVTFPGGESMLEMQRRVVGACRGIVERHAGQRVAIFSHGDPIKAILADALGMRFDDFQRLDVAPGSVSVIDHTGERPVVRLVGGGPGVAVPILGGGATVGGSAGA